MYASSIREQAPKDANLAAVTQVARLFELVLKWENDASQDNKYIHIYIYICTHTHTLAHVLLVGLLASFGACIRIHFGVLKVVGPSLASPTSLDSIAPEPSTPKPPNLQLKLLSCKPGARLPCS